MHYIAEDAETTKGRFERLKQLSNWTVEITFPVEMLYQAKGVPQLTFFNVCRTHLTWLNTQRHFYEPQFFISGVTYYDAVCKSNVPYC